ncbi:MAG: glycosyltransferase family 25 protein [Candidatus Omnitrophica bacterium]|nr:glycosyltransferase family 25 protein [Candidatus Omnitrophota bacterium]
MNFLKRIFWRQPVAMMCINLKRATERRREIERLWCRERGFRIEFFEAFDRRRIEAGEVVFPQNEKDALVKMGRPLLLGEVACLTSHALALQRALQKNYSEVIIMEDDVVPLVEGPEEFFSRIAQCRKTYPGVNAILCHRGWGNHAQYYPGEANGDKLLKLPFFGAALTWFDRPGMEFALERLKRMACPADWIWRGEFCAAKRLGALVPPLADHLGQDTYIDDGRRGTKREFRP